MSIRNLEIMVGRAVVSDRFRAGILNGHRAELIREIGLEPDEVAEVMAIRADSLVEFSAAVEQMVRARETAQATAFGSSHAHAASASAGMWLGRPVTGALHLHP